MTTTTTITLNTTIFKEVSKYLINDKFNRILEYSLLSKYIYKIISNHLINNSKLVSPYPFNSLKKYIDDNNSPTKNNLSLYKYKLLQYKQIKYICITIPLNKELGLIKKYLNIFCQNLKCARIFNRHTVKFTKEEEEDEEDYEEVVTTDDTFRGFFKFEKVLLHWEYYNYPCSNRKESIQVYKLGNISLVKKYPFSFEILERYKPRKVYIDTRIRKGGAIQLSNIDNILKQRSIGTIKFLDQETPHSFLKKAVSLETIKSLSIAFHITDSKFPLDDIDLNYLLDESGLVNNTSLKRLDIKRYTVKGYDPTHLFQLIGNNKSLKALGLEVYDINDQFKLEPLYKFINITVLYCHIDNLKYFLVHCLNGSSNIKKLKFKVSSKTDFKEYVDMFTLFFNQNQTLLSISIITDTTYEDSKFSNSLSKLSKSCNSICKIKTNKIITHN